MAISKNTSTKRTNPAAACLSKAGANRCEKSAASNIGNGFSREEYCFALRYLAEFLDRADGQPIETYDLIATEVMFGMTKER